MSLTQESAGGVILGTPPANSREDHFVHLEFTLTYPHVQSWLKKTTKQQQKFYNMVFHEIKNICGIPHYTEIQPEYHANGLVHAHAIIIYKNKKGYNIEGMLLDFVRAYIEYLPKCSRNIKIGCIHSDKHYYQSAPIKISFIDATERPERQAEWIQYIRKDIEKYLS